MAGKSYRDLETWQRSMDLVAEVYEATSEFPKEETYGLRSQLRRAAVSIPSNLAEGQGRDSPREFVRHLSIAYGSLCEVETQILIAKRLTFLERDAAETLMHRCAEVGRLINGLSRAIAKQLS
ncbi:MAG: four helix bundle protein [Blastocatellia bacterium]|nr:four helix bundle protein [Blastocatellia bacterium]